jgi:hypothetical protein
MGKVGLAVINHRQHSSLTLTVLRHFVRAPFVAFVAHKYHCPSLSLFLWQFVAHDLVVIVPQSDRVWGSPVKV